MPASTLDVDQSVTVEVPSKGSHTSAVFQDEKGRVLNCTVEAVSGSSSRRGGEEEYSYQKG